MKYIDADLLRMDIDEWKEAMADAVGDYSDGVRFASEHFTFLITHYSRQEQQEVDLEEEITNFIQAHYHIRYDNTLENGNDSLTVFDFEDIARHFAEWQKSQMLKDAVEGEICGRVYDHINVRFADGVCKYLEPKNISHIPADVSKYNIGDKVRILVLKAEEE